MCKILSEGRRAKITLRGINVGVYLSSDKVASQIKTMLLLQFPIFCFFSFPARNKPAALRRARSLWSHCKSAGPPYLHSGGEPDGGSLISRGKSSEEEKSPPSPPPPPPSLLLPRCLRASSPSSPCLPAALMKISCQSRSSDRHAFIPGLPTFTAAGAG